MDKKEGGVIFGTSSIKFDHHASEIKLAVKCGEDAPGQEKIETPTPPQEKEKIATDTPPKTNEGIIITPAGEYKPIYKKSDKVVIVGCADSKNHMPPGDHHAYEWWGVNNLALTLQRPWTRWFEIHHFAYDGQNFRRRGSLEFRGQAVNAYLEMLNAYVK